MTRKTKQKLPSADTAPTAQREKELGWKVLLRLKHEAHKRAKPALHQLIDESAATELTSSSAHTGEKLPHMLTGHFIVWRWLCGSHTVSAWWAAWWELVRPLMWYCITTVVAFFFSASSLLTNLACLNDLVSSGSYILLFNMCLKCPVCQIFKEVRYLKKLTWQRVLYIGHYQAASLNTGLPVQDGS